jgi:hypothetical protein
MGADSTPEPNKETFFVYDMSPELEEELLRRAREEKTNPSAEATNIIEQHVEDASTDELD